MIDFYTDCFKKPIRKLEILLLLLLSSCTSNDGIHFNTLEKGDDGLLYEKFDPKIPFNGICKDAMGNYQGEVKNGTVNGTINLFYPNSNKIYESLNYRNNVLNGLVTTYCENQKIVYQVTYVNGLSNGDSLFYGCLDKLVSKSSLKNGVLHGHFYKYYINSDQLEFEGEYFDGKESGTWHFYDSLGKISTKIY